MSAISFSTHVDKEEDDKGTWVVIKLRGKGSLCVSWFKRSLVTRQVAALYALLKCFLSSGPTLIF